MERYVLISFAIALILMVLCILIFSKSLKEKRKLGRVLVTVLGIVPGFVMVLVSFILLMIEINTKNYLSMLSAGLLLEVGSVQLYHILKKNNIKR